MNHHLSINSKLLCMVAMGLFSEIEEDPYIQAMMERPKTILLKWLKGSERLENNIGLKRMKLSTDLHIRKM